MRSKQFATGAAVAAILGAAVAAGCGGGGGSTALPGPGPNPSPSVKASASPSPSPSTSPSPSPSVSPSPAASPVLQAAGMQIATGGTVGAGFTYGPVPMADEIVFSCGCFPEAGTAPVQAKGAFMATSPATPTPAGSPYVMVAGRNYLVVGEPLNGSGPQGWTLLFEGKAPATTLGLGDNGSVFASAAVSNVFTTAAALYVYKESAQCGPGGCETAFDDWNFNAVETWMRHVESTLPGDPSPGPNNAERVLLNDIAAQSVLNASLFPKAPKWNPAQPSNATIAADLNAVVGSNDTDLPTPCPGGPAGCTGTPTP